MRPTSTTTSIRSPLRHHHHRAGALPPLSCPLPKPHVALRVEQNVPRRPVVLKAAEVQPLDPTADLFAKLSSAVAAAADGNGNDVSVAFASPSSSSSSSSSSPSTSGRGLVATRPLSRGEVALRVPGSVCLVVDYSSRGKGLSLPQGQSSGRKEPSSPSSLSPWPRTSAAVAKDPSTPWDFLLALALLDAVSGDGGGEWWEAFAVGVLPLPSIGEEEEEVDGDEEEDKDDDSPVIPSLLTLPLCLPQELLKLAGHKDLEEAALEQQKRLKETYPGLAIPASASSEFPTMMQWALACVRSRAFALSESSSSRGGGGGGSAKASGGSGKEENDNKNDDKNDNDETDDEEEDEGPAFAFVPLLDCANHSSRDPAAAYRAIWTESEEENGTRKLAAVELVALRDVARGEEVSISYFAEGSGATNRRLFSVYGFVPAGGNPGDRVEGLGEVNVERVVESSSPPPALDLDLFMDLLGPQVSRDIMQGKNPYLFAAIKSLPLLQTSKSSSEDASTSSSSSTSSKEQQQQLTRALLAEVESQLLEVEEAAASQGRQAEDDAALAREAELETIKKKGRGAARAAVLRYRAERGALLRAARAALRLYTAASG